MDSTTSNIEDVTMSEVLELATWNRERTDEELESFISSREAAVLER